MKDMGFTQGSAAQAVPLIIGKDTVYVHTDIRESEDSGGNVVFGYYEIQYDKDEYIQLMSEKNDILEQVVADIAMLQLGV